MEYIQEVKKKFPLDSINKELDKLKDLNVLVIGDTIIDEYVFTMPKGRAIKDPILSLDFIKSERYAGGILAIANHIAGFTNGLSLVTILGDHRREEDFIKKSLNKNISTKFFTKKESPTTNKKRFIDHLRNGKLFKVEYINDESIDEETESKLIDYLKEELPKYDLIIVGDFGHGFITDNIVKVLQEHSKFLAANVQTNSANLGFNYITKYKKIDYITTNENEIRLTLSNRFGDSSKVINELKENVQFKDILLTQGVEGCLYVRNGKIYSGPSLTKDVKDVVGAGDTVFAITSLLSYNAIDGELLIFIANCVGAISVNTMGNKDRVTKESLLKFIGDLK